jgi:hypothetical protein
MEMPELRVLRGQDASEGVVVTGGWAATNTIREALAVLDKEVV